MQTPTTTTRENSGALVMMPSMMPGTPTHSKMTGCLGFAAPAASAARQRCHQGSRSLLQLLDRADREVERVEDAL